MASGSLEVSDVTGLEEGDDQPSTLLAQFPAPRRDGGLGHHAQQASSQPVARGGGRGYAPPSSRPPGGADGGDDGGGDDGFEASRAHKQKRKMKNASHMMIAQQAMVKAQARELAAQQQQALTYATNRSHALHGGDVDHHGELPEGSGGSSDSAAGFDGGRGSAVVYLDHRHHNAGATTSAASSLDVRSHGASGIGVSDEFDEKSATVFTAGAGGGIGNKIYVAPPGDASPSSGAALLARGARPSDGDGANVNAAKGSCIPMLKPQGVFRVFWDAATIVFLAYISIALPVRVGLRAHAVPHTIGWYWETMIDFYFVCDILVNFRTGIVHDDGTEVMHWQPVAANYLKGWFIIDVTSSMPYEIIISLIGSMANLSSLSAVKLLKFSRIMKTLKVIKLLRLARAAKIASNSTYMDKFEEIMYSSSSAQIIKVSRLILGVFYTCHVLGCFWALVGYASEPSWFMQYTDLDDDGEVDDDDALLVVEDGASEATVEYNYAKWAGRPATKWRLWRQYVVCFYWAMTTITTVGYGDICPSSDLGRIYASVAMLIGGGVYGFIIANMSSLVADLDANKKGYFEKMDLINSYMGHHRFPPELKTKMRQ